MFNKKLLFKKFAVLGVTMLVPAIISTPVMAATNSNTNINSSIKKIDIENSVGTMGEDNIEPYWLAPGPMTRYPAEGGTWEYGFWNAKVRSYYTAEQSHGSTVKLGNKESRSIDTAAGKKSIAELWAIQSDKDDQYFYR